MFSGWFAKVLGVGSRQVGSDYLGNKYFVAPEHSGSRRSVQFSHPDERMDSIPPPWRAWLTKSRDDRPSHQEIEAWLQQQEIYRRNVKKVEEREAKEMAEQALERQSNPHQISGESNVVEMPNLLNQVQKAQISENLARESPSGNQSDQPTKPSQGFQQVPTLEGLPPKRGAAKYFGNKKTQ
eukprot:TRINITY_DN6356_c0_g1_i1.p1 TRINITY_DN6356_c0_g1~~TRINITY_DN6356_c0_g1_i1.p1  ORF type:complete len:182 (+),score=32.52 TRINITY_DN6356_c0_g1_i1:18-563(+)